MACLGWASRGEVRGGEARHGETGHGTAALVRLGLPWRGESWRSGPGWAWHDASRDGGEWLGMVGHGLAGGAGRGVACVGEARPGGAWQGRCGTVGQAWLGVVRPGRVGHGAARRDRARVGLAWQGRHGAQGMARRGVTRPHPPVRLVQLHDPLDGSMAWAALSRSHPGLGYLLRAGPDGRWLCGCPAAAFRDPCPHQAALYALLQPRKGARHP